MNGSRTSEQTGFTIVELLIVIVVIAILATITIVAFNGVQNRANDTAVQADVNNYVRKAKEFNVTNGEYPNTTNELDSLGVQAAQSAYDPSTNNLFYCTRVNTQPADIYVFAARSKSGTIYYVSSNGSGTLTGNINITVVCNIIGLNVSSAEHWGNSAYTSSPATWKDWAI